MQVEVQILSQNILKRPVHITTKVLSSNPAHGEVYSMHHYVIKFVSATAQYTYKCTMQCLRNNYLMLCSMLILT